MEGCHDHWVSPQIPTSGLGNRHTTAANSWNNQTNLNISCEIPKIPNCKKNKTSEMNSPLLQVCSWRRRGHQLCREMRGGTSPFFLVNYIEHIPLDIFLTAPNTNEVSLINALPINFPFRPREKLLIFQTFWTVFYRFLSSEILFNVFIISLFNDAK